MKFFKSISFLFITVIFFSVVFARNLYAASPTWSNGISLPQGLYLSTSVQYNGYEYVIGGSNSLAPLSTVYYSQIGSNGELGSWNTTTSLPVGLGDSTSVEYNGYIYEIGGSNGTANINTVYYSQVGSNGVLGTWNTTTSLPVSLSEATSIEYNGYIYEIGGNTSLSPVNSSASVYYSKIGTNGVLGAWNTATSLPVSLSEATSVEYNGYIYEIGGSSVSSGAGTPSSAVYYSQVGTNGVLGSWNTTSALPQNIINSSSVVSNSGYLYELGGATGSSGAIQSTVYYTQIGTSGTIGTWNSTTSLPQAAQWVMSTIVPLLLIIA